MVKNKSNSRKKVRKRTTSKLKPALGWQLFKSLIGLAVLVAIVIGSGLLIHAVLKHKAVPVTELPGSVSRVNGSPGPKPSLEVYPKETKPLPKPAAGLKDHLPSIAIIIDDIGYNRQEAERFISLGHTLTLSFFPQGTYRNEIAQKAHEKGCEVMLHQPMEPNEYPKINPGKSALLMSMKPDELIDQLERNIEAIPHVKGVNNHMGSKLTASSAQMYQIFSVLKQRGLYFVDSRTTDQTICRPSARLFHVPFAERDIFIDNIQAHPEIRKQLEKLVLIAGRHGRAIGIGHPHQTTYEVLKEMLPQLKKKVRLLPASKLARVDA